MHLVKFLLFGAVLSFSLGEFGHFPFGNIGSAIYISDVLLILSLIFFAIYQVVTSSKTYLPKNFYYLILFLSAAGLSLLYSLFLFDALTVALGSLYLFRFILYSSVLVLTFNLLKNGVLAKEQLITLLIVVSLVLSLLGFFQLITFSNLSFLTDFGFDPHQGRLVATFLDPNFLGCFLTVGFILSVYKIFSGQRRAFFKAAFLLIFLAIILTFSRSAYLMMFVSSLSLGVLRWKRLFLIMVALGVISFFLFPRFGERLKSGLLIDETVQERFLSWNEGLKIFFKSPLFGVGFNNLRTYKISENLTQTYSVEGGHSGSGIDSSFLLVLATTGLLGFLTYLMFWFKTVAGLYQIKDNCKITTFGILVGLLVSGQFINLLFYPPIMLSYFLILGLFDD